MTTIRLRFMLLCVLSAILAGAAAFAQSAPAGNAHPDHAIVEEGAAENPFGPTPRHSDASIEQKHEFARGVDLSALRDLAVFHNGRVKILESLAAESIESVTGRRKYQDVSLADGGRRVEKRSYDPLFTFFDLLIDPAYYFDKPLVHIEYLPARRAFATLAHEDPIERERAMKLTRLSPEVVARHFSAVAEQHAANQQFSRALQKARSSLEILEYGHTALLMIAPPDESSDWRHVSALASDSEVQDACAALAESWRARDAEGVERAAAALADRLPQINRDQYPTTRRELEAVYNRVNPFEYGYWLYFVSLLSLVLAFGAGRRWLVAIGLATLIGAISLHAFGFGARWIIAERLPIQNQFESMTGLALGGALAGLVLMIARRQWLFGAAGAGVGFLVLLAATQTDIPGAAIGREAAILNTSWLLKYHVTTVLVSYGLIGLAFIISLFYLGAHYGARAKASRESVEFAAHGLGLDRKAPAGPQRVLSDLDTAQMTVIQLAFWTLGVGILLGAWWADHSWGRWWAFDPKETWALLTWIVYLVVIHVRFTTSRNRALVTAWLSVAGFFVMLWTYFGVNLILPGLHAYA